LTEPTSEGKLIPNCKPVGCRVLVAVSNTDDPAGGWSIFPFNFGYIIPDYPHIATSIDKVIFNVNDFGIKYDTFTGSRIVVADKNSMLNGQSVNIPYLVTDQDDRFFTTLPVRGMDSSNCNYLVSVGQAIPKPIAFNLQLFKVCGNPLTKDVTINLDGIPMIDNPTILPVSAAQPPTAVGPSKQLDTGDLRILSSVFNNGNIINSMGTSCTVENVKQACIRIQVLNTTNNSFIVNENVGVRGNDLAKPSVSVNNEGKLRYITAISGANTNLSLLAGNENNDLKLIAQSAGPMDDQPMKPIDKQPVNRLGDYFSSAVDPIDGSIWVSGEYVSPQLLGPWSTMITHIP